MMNKELLAFLLLFRFISAVAAECPHAVTYEFSGGRFGDNLLSYLHAKWLSCTYGIPLLYKPFPYSSDLALHDLETRLELVHYRQRIRTSVSNIEGDIQSATPLLFVCPYFPEDRIERIEDNYSFFDIDWKDPEFRKTALEMIGAKKTLRLIEPPANSINVAIHVRLGENYDDDAFRLRFPLKLPPLEFYLEAVSKVLELFRGKSVYCHVFTDAEQPERIVEVLKTAAPSGLSVKFGYRRGLSRQNWNVLDDFFSFFSFDALIRSQSHFSMIPSLLHDFAVLCYPSDFTRANDRPKITKMEVQVDEILYQRLMREK